jgi:hypothetical protein
MWKFDSLAMAIAMIGILVSAEVDASSFGPRARGHISIERRAPSDTDSVKVGALGPRGTIARRQSAEVRLAAIEGPSCADARRAGPRATLCL